MSGLMLSLYCFNCQHTSHKATLSTCGHDVIATNIRNVQVFKFDLMPRLPSTPSKLVDMPPPIHGTPIDKKVSGATPYTSMHYKRDTRMRALGSEMKDKFAGPVDPQEFLHFFLPFERGKLPRMPKRMKVPFQRVADQTTEPAMYDPMVCPPVSACCIYSYEPSRLKR